jgi:hypothetical protein
MRNIDHREHTVVATGHPGSCATMSCQPVN